MGESTALLGQPGKVRALADYVSKGFHSICHNLHFHCIATREEGSCNTQTLPARTAFNLLPEFNPQHFFFSQVIPALCILESTKSWGIRAEDGHTCSFRMSRAIWNALDNIAEVGFPTAVGDMHKWDFWKCLLLAELPLSLKRTWKSGYRGIRVPKVSDKHISSQSTQQLCSSYPIELELLLSAVSLQKEAECNVSL